MIDMDIDPDLRTALIRVAELNKRLLNGGVDPEDVMDATHALANRQYVVPGIPEPWDNQLPSLHDQYGLLCRYNDLYWGNQISEQLAEIKGFPDVHYTQPIENCQILYVSFGSNSLDIVMWLLALAGELECDIGTEIEPRFWDAVDGLPQANYGQAYIQGIHGIRLNLIGIWNSWTGTTAKQARKKAASRAWKLAHAEALAAYAMAPGLLLQAPRPPAPILAGYGPINWGGEALSPRLNYDRESGTVGLALAGVETRFTQACAPTILT